MLKGKPEDWLALQRQWRQQFKEEYRELRRAAAESKGGRARGGADRRALVAGGAAADSGGVAP
jgi:hypothetical protein